MFDLCLELMFFWQLMFFLVVVEIELGRWVVIMLL